MTPYIPKSALVEKINNWIKDAKRKYTMSKVQFSLDDRIKSLEKLLSFLDTLEVKEVDLQKEIHKFIDNEELHLRLWDVDRIAKHFFELGIKAKGE